MEGRQSRKRKKKEKRDVLDYLNDDLLVEELLPFVLAPGGGDASFDETVEEGGGLREGRKKKGTDRRVSFETREKRMGRKGNGR